MATMNPNERALLNEMIGRAMLDVSYRSAILDKRSRSKAIDKLKLGKDARREIRLAPDRDLQSFASHLYNTLF